MTVDLNYYRIFTESDIFAASFCTYCLRSAACGELGGDCGRPSHVYTLVRTSCALF